MPQDFQPATRQRPGRRRLPVVHATPPQLPPMHPGRLATIRHLVDRSFTATPKQAQVIAGKLKQLNPSAGERDYISRYSAEAGDAAMRKANPLNAKVAQVAQLGVNPRAFAHPLARLEGKGEFAPTDVVTHDAHGRPQRGYASILPWFGRANLPAATSEAAVAAPAAAKAAEPVAAAERTVEMSEQQAAHRLAHLDKQYEALVAKFADAVNPYTPETARSETLSRNTMRGRMAAGKKPATGRAVEGRMGAGSRPIKTIAQELRDLAEAKIQEVISKHPDDPAAIRVGALIRERDHLHDLLTARHEAGLFGTEPPPLPTLTLPPRPTGAIPASERPGSLPGWSPQGQIFPRPDAPGRYPPPQAAPSTLFPSDTIPGSALSPQGEAFPRPPLSQAAARRANPLPRETPQIPRGVATDRTGGQLGQQIRESMAQAKDLRREQEQGYSVERGERFSAFEQKLRENPTVAGYHTALRELKGELPKLHFAGFENFDQSALDALFKHVVYHPTLRAGEKARTLSALERIARGTVPTNSEIGLLEQVFGHETAGNLARSVSTWQRLKWRGLDALNVPRSLMASFDVSAPFRQGLVVAVTHPAIFTRNLAPMFKSLASEDAYQALLAEIHARPTYPLMEGRVAFTELGRTLSRREEQFQSSLAEAIPGIGHAVRGSGRAYTGFLDKTRADVFDFLLEKAIGLGRDPKDERLLEGIAGFVNSATGRGSLGALKNHAVTLNTLMFSPRLLASRLNFLNPVWYVRLDPFARREAVKAAASLAATMGFVLYMAHLAGADVELDPRSSDWAKIRIGDTRIDLAGGFQQPLRLAAQLASQQTISSTTGKTIDLGASGPGKVSSWDIVQRFARSKAAPIPSLALDLLTRQTFSGQPLTAQGAALSRLTPLAGQDAVDLARDRGSVPAGLAGYGLGAVGVGIQTYKPRKATVSGSFAPAPSGGAPQGERPTYTGGRHVYDGRHATTGKRHTYTGGR